jgi:hypothetical protein
MARVTQYYVTEAEVSKLFRQSGLPSDFQNLFGRDYVALKADASTIGDLVDTLTDRVLISEGDIAAIETRLDVDEAEIASQGLRITIVESDLSALTIEFDAHTADASAHNATGNILGTDDYATLAIGGSVLKAVATADATPSSVNAVLTPTVAGAGYVQATAQTWVDAINEHKTAINQLNTNINALITLFNASLLTERNANQRAP